MEEARAVLARLKRIEALERDGAGVPSLLPELRELVREATEWAEREGDPRARAAAAALAASTPSDDPAGLTDPSRTAVTLARPWPPTRSSDSASCSFSR
jgi:hypothetical protein